MRREVLLIVVLIFLFSVSSSFAEGLEFKVKGGYAPITGYVQTPAGGEPGTSDIKRPTFSEVGVNNTTYFDVDLEYNKYKYRPYLGMRFLSIASTGIVEEDLTTRNQTAFAGEAFDFKTSFNIYRFGVKRDFAWISPKAEVALMDFKYEFKSPSVQAERSYAKAGYRLGAEKLFRFDQFEIVLEASASIPIPNTVDLYTVGIEAKYHLTSYLNMGVEVQYFYLNYKDGQELPNHLRLEMRPALSFFLQFVF